MVGFVDCYQHNGVAFTINSLKFQNAGKVEATKMSLFDRRSS